MTNQKQVFFRIYDLLLDKSDEQHPFMQKDIIDYLYHEYGLEVERKAVGRIIQELKELGLPIITTKKGAFISKREFDENELMMLILSISGCKYLNSEDSKTLIQKIGKLGGSNFKFSDKYICGLDKLNKSNNQDFLSNITMIYDAIEQNRQIQFWYNKHNINKELVHTEGMHKVSPYEIIMQNQNCYLLCNDPKYANEISVYRIDKITGMKIAKRDSIIPPNAIPGAKDMLDITKACQHPYMHLKKPEPIVIEINVKRLDDIIDYFGMDIKIRSISSQKLRVEFVASSSDVEYWALQYGKEAEVIMPRELRNKIILDIKEMQKKYSRIVSN